MKCTVCERELVFNEMGLSRKFAGGVPYCMTCLSEKLHVTEERLREKIEEFLRAGCLMFVKED